MHISTCVEHAYSGVCARWWKIVMSMFVTPALLGHFTWCLEKLLVSPQAGLAQRSSCFVYTCVRYMHTYMYACIHAHTHTHMYVGTHQNTYTKDTNEAVTQQAATSPMHTVMILYTFVHICTHTHVYWSTHKQFYTRVYTHMASMIADQENKKGCCACGWVEREACTKTGTCEPLTHHAWHMYTCIHTLYIYMYVYVYIA
jgi:hypothetical protein